MQKEKDIKYLPLWAATSTGAQDMFPALFPGLVYTIDLLNITDSKISFSFTAR